MSCGRGNERRAHGSATGRKWKTYQGRDQARSRSFYDVIKMGTRNEAARNGFEGGYLYELIIYHPLVVTIELDRF